MLKKHIFILCTIGLLSGCYPTRNTQGNFVDVDIVQQLIPGRSTKSEIREALGPPTTTNFFITQDSWYYIGEKTEKTSFFNPKILERLVVEINFDTEGVAQKIHMYDQKDGYSIEPDQAFTPTYGRDPSFLADVFGNFGKYEAPGQHRKKKTDDN
jgi:outer membrane protein assembly factor BamE (lipoprotein component of BamABCDE complex)